MPQLILIENDGTEHRLACESGQSVMRAAMAGGVPGVLADCGGACNCATCHGYVEPEWARRLAEPSQQERELIAFALDVQASSRLTCQIVMTPELDGLVVRLPQSQV